MNKEAGGSAARFRVVVLVRLEGVADDAEDRVDLTAEEEQGRDSQDGDEGEDEGVLGESLAAGRRKAHSASTS